MPSAEIERLIKSAIPDAQVELTALVNDLVNDKTYRIRVRAVTAAGPGAEAGPVTVFDPGFPVHWHVEA